MKTTPGWLAIVGGPWDGGEFYPPRDYKPGERVEFMTAGIVHWIQCLPETHGYCVSRDGKALVWGKR